MAYWVLPSKEMHAHIKECKERYFQELEERFSRECAWSPEITLEQVMADWESKISLLNNETQELLANNAWLLIGYAVCELERYKAIIDKGGASRAEVHQLVSALKAIEKAIPAVLEKLDGYYSEVDLDYSTLKVIQRPVSMVRQVLQRALAGNER